LAFCSAVANKVLLIEALGALGTERGSTIVVSSSPGEKWIAIVQKVNRYRLTFQSVRRLITAFALLTASLIERPINAIR
jgi:hypothetical protein